MASPQKENGFTPICHELLEAIYRSPFNATQLKIIMVICRFTYGWSRKEHSISESFIATAANISKRYVRSELNKLVEKKVVEVIKPYVGTSARILSINKDYKEWEFKTENLEGNNTPPEEQYIPPTEEQYIPPKRGATHPPTKKGLNQKESIEQIEKIWSLYPNKKGKAVAMKKIPKLIEKYGCEKIEKCIKRYMQEKEKWKEYQHGSTFFNTGYMDYLETEEIKNEVVKLKPIKFIER